MTDMNYQLHSALRMADELADTQRQQAIAAIDRLKGDVQCSARWPYAHSLAQDIHQWLVSGSHWKTIADDLRKRVSVAAMENDL